MTQWLEPRAWPGTIVADEVPVQHLVTEAGVLPYRSLGDGPPLVLLHGSGSDASGWPSFRDVLRPLAEFFRCLLPELPGFDVDDSVGRFIEAMGLDTVNLLGDASGAAIALRYAATHPGRIDRVVAVGGADRSGSAAAFKDEQTHRVDAPVLLIWGREDRVSPVSTGVALMQAIPNAELHVFPRCGHEVILEAREAFLDAALSFLLRAVP